MIKIQGCLSAMFMWKNRPIWEDIDINSEKYQKIVNSMINMPIKENEKIIGVITGVDLEKDEWTGYLLKSECIELSENHQSLVSLSLI